jgi:divalent metal cation (Fe/Co/Zn/Cd) transporter
LLDTIVSVAQATSELPLHVHHIHIHTYGDHSELSCHIKLPKEMTLVEAHEVCTRIEKAILAEFGYITTVHPEPL